jgi:hypothetical protein
MADAMALASARAESAQIVAQKDADIARLKYDLLVERGEKERLSKVGENLGRINSALEGELETCLELLRLERGKTARLSAALTKARAFRDKVDTMRHEMQRFYEQPGRVELRFRRRRGWIRKHGVPGTTKHTRNRNPTQGVGHGSHVRANGHAG